MQDIERLAFKNGDSRKVLYTAKHLPSGRDGLETLYTMGGFVHVLLVVAIVSVLVRVISGRTAI